MQVSVGVARFFVVVEFQMDEPSPRSHHFSAAVVDKLNVWGGGGGLGESVVTSIIHHYDPDSETWNTNTCEGPHPPGIRWGACASAGHHLYTYGGRDEGGNEQGTLHLLDTRSRRWKLISSEGGRPMEKTGCGMIIYDSKIVLFGGFSNNRNTNELHTFNLKEGERLHIATYPLMQFSCVAGVVVSNSDLDIERGIVCYTLALLIFGSNVSHFQVPIQTLFDTAVDVWACSLIFMCFLSGTWSSPTITGTRPPPCQNFSFTMVDESHAVLFGGSSDSRWTNDVYMLDLSRMVSCVELTWN